MEAVGLRTEARSHWLEGKRHREASFGTCACQRLDTTNPGPPFCRRETEAQRGEGAAQGHSEVSLVRGAGPLVYPAVT